MFRKNSVQCTDEFGGYQKAWLASELDLENISMKLGINIEAKAREMVA